MVAWWHFDETEGELANDIEGQVNNLGSLMNNVTMVSGVVGGAFSFNGANFVEVADSSELNFGTGNFSIDLWIRTEDSNTGVKTLIDKRDGSELNRTGYLFYLYKGRPGLQIGDGTKTNYNTPDIPNIPLINDGKWHHLAVTVERTNPNGIKFYIDGALVAVFDPTTHMGDITNTSHLLIGYNLLSTGQSFIGTLDEIELFNRVLSPDEVKAIYAANNNGKCKPTINVKSASLDVFLIDDGKEINLGNYKIDESGVFEFEAPEVLLAKEDPLLKFNLNADYDIYQVKDPTFYIQIMAKQQTAEKTREVTVRAEKHGDKYVGQVAHF